MLHNKLINQPNKFFAVVLSIGLFLPGQAFALSPEKTVHSPVVLKALRDSLAAAGRSEVRKKLMAGKIETDTGIRSRTRALVQQFLKVGEVGDDTTTIGVGVDSVEVRLDWRKPMMDHWGNPVVVVRGADKRPLSKEEEREDGARKEAYEPFKVGDQFTLRAPQGWGVYTLTRISDRAVFYSAETYLTDTYLKEKARQSSRSEARGLGAEESGVAPRASEQPVVDFNKVVGNAVILIPSNQQQVLATVTSDPQIALLFAADFAFDAERPGFLLIPVLAGNNPAAVIVRTGEESRTVDDFNSHLPVGVAPILKAGNIQTAVNLLKQRMSRLERQGVRPIAGTQIHAIVTPFSQDIKILEQIVGKGGVFVATARWFHQVAEMAGLDTVIEAFKTQLATRQAA